MSKPLLNPEHSEAQGQISNGKKTLNQIRQELGLEPIEDERCNVLITKE